MTQVTIQVNELGQAEVIATTPDSVVDVTTRKEAGGSVENSDQSYTATVDGGATLVLPDINITQLDNSVVTAPSVKDIDVDNYLGAVLESITLSVEADAAIKNIESNGGSLTDEERYYVSIWVDRMVANGDWALLDFLAYAGFANSSCALTDWISGTLMTNSGATLDGDHYDFSGGGYIATGFNQTSLTDITDAFYGWYAWDKVALNADAFGGAYDGTTYCIPLYKDNGGNAEAWMNTSAKNLNLSYGYDSYLGRGLWVCEQTNATNITVYLNGVQDYTRLSTAGSAVNKEWHLNGFNNNGSSNSTTAAKLDLFVVGTATSFDHEDFYIGFEDFRTSLHPEILYSFPSPTGQTTSYRTGDDAWIETNFLSHFRKAQSYWNGTRPELVDFTTLKQNNVFGNTNRFTDELGGQAYANDLIIDHLAGLMWYSIDHPLSSGNWDTAIDTPLGSLFGGSQTQGSYTDWFCGNLNMIESLRDSGTYRTLGYAPFSYNINAEIITSTTTPGQTTSCNIYDNATDDIKRESKTNTNSYLDVGCRLYLGET